jgi:hypothetical protein
MRYLAIDAPLGLAVPRECPPRWGATQGRDGATITTVRVDDLPSYFDLETDAPPPAVRSLAHADAPTAPPVVPAMATLVPLDVAVNPPTPSAVVVQVVPVAPDVASAHVRAWSAVLRAGRDALTVRGTTPPRPCCASHVRVEVRRRGRPPLTIEVGCGPWSSARAELHVVPARHVRGDRRRYYRAAHAVLDRLARDLR